MTFQEKFDELKAKYGKVDESKLSEPFAIQVNMTDDESAGTFYVAYMNDVFAVEPYDYHDHTAMITLPVKELEAVLSKKADAVQLFFAGVLKVEGNLDHALKLVELMAKEEKKPAAAKSVVKEIAAEAEKITETVKKAASKATGKKAAPAKKTAEKKDTPAEEEKAEKKPAAKKTAKKTAGKKAE